jgi:carbamoyltransferase
VWHQVLAQPRAFVMRHGYWGPEFGAAEVESALAARRTDLTAGDCLIRTMPNEYELCEWTAARIADGDIVGWFQGRMEWGARALGNRSILANPGRADMRDIINSKIKFREKFRPFAPSVLEDAHADYFVGSVPDPFMMQVYPVRPDKRETLPAITHVDGSGRLQTVSATGNPRYSALLRAVGRRTGAPIVLNTSFNENEPIVHQPSEAIDCFLRTRMDVLVLGNYVVTKRCHGTARPA